MILPAAIAFFSPLAASTARPVPHASATPSGAARETGEPTLIPPATRPTRAPASVLLPAGTPIGVELTQDVNSKNAQNGEFFHFVTLDDTKVDGRIAIPEHTTGIGVVGLVSSAGSHGHMGSLLLEARELHLAPGLHVQVTLDRKFTDLSATGHERGLPWFARYVTRYVPHLGVISGAYDYLHHGKNVTLEKGTIFFVVTLEDTTVPAAPELKRNQARPAPGATPAANAL